MKPLKSEILNAWSEASDSLLYFVSLSFLDNLSISLDLNLIDSLSFEIKKFLRENNVE
jgi:hypothetical protein